MKGRNRNGITGLVGYFRELVKQQVRNVCTRDLVENEEVLILQTVVRILSVAEEQLACLFNFDGLAILEGGIGNTEVRDLAIQTRSGDSQDGRGFSDGTCVLISSHHKVLDYHASSSTDGVKIIEDVIYQGLI